MDNTYGPIGECSVCDEEFTEEEWDIRHTAPDGSDVHDTCCRWCPVNTEIDDGE